MPDSLGLRDALFDLPEQLVAASRSLPVTGPLPEHDDIANVLLLGTGAAGWACDLLAAVAGPFMPVPVVVHKGFEPPSFVDATTLVVAISASGDSPEAVASATTSVEAGGRLFAVTSGGQLGALADQQAAPTVFLPVATSPSHVVRGSSTGSCACRSICPLAIQGLGWIRPSQSARLGMRP